MSWLKPAPGRISSPFGTRVAPTAGATTFHEGADIAAVNGSRAIASAAGTVTVAGLSGGWGGLVVISHGGGHTTYYAHMSRIDVHVRDKVTQGQQIGLTGGRIGQWGAGTSTGSHCHTEHRINGTPVDPVPYWTTINTAGIGEKIMALDADDKEYLKESLDELGQAIIEQIRGEGPYDYSAQPNTLRRLRDDIGYIHDGSADSLKAIHQAILGVKPGVASTTDVTPILTAIIKALPASTVAALKAAL